MALVKKANPQMSKADGDQRHQPRDLNSLVAALEDIDASIRRWAARDLAAFPEAASALGRRLQVENQLAVREAILDSLLQIGGEVVVAQLTPMLRSDDAALRNGVIEVLQGLPDAVAPHMQRLLHDDDSDVRIFAIDILQVLQHPDTPKWLVEVVEHEEHVNVVGTAVDRLAEVGTPDMLPALERLRTRWQDQGFIRFAIDAVIQRIKGA